MNIPRDLYGPKKLQNCQMAPQLVLRRLTNDHYHTRIKNLLSTTMLQMNVYLHVSDGTLGQPDHDMTRHGHSPSTGVEEKDVTASNSK
jgi:hypothetical protein